AFFAWLLLGETLGPQGWVGAILILGAAVYNNQSFSEIFGGEMSEATNPIIVNTSSKEERGGE
ncbi:unnamed protein product, partial [Heterosigma akashiwo]